MASAEIAALEEQTLLGTRSAETLSDALQSVAMNALRQQFRPEFLNRIDDIVVYRRLGREQIRAVVDIQLARVVERLSKRQIQLEVSEEAKDWLAESGFDPQFGARPLKRSIQRHVEDEIASRILSGQLVQGDVVRVSVSGGTLRFVSQKPN
ncbi:MAG: hypothetical protein QM784_34700 [Polyangiaceae bacterium]